jgi:outer membrane protein assembly factor BamA
MRKFTCLFLLSAFLSTGKIIASGTGTKDTSTTKKTGSFLLFPFLLRSPETSVGFGAASAFFFKTKEKDTLIRTSDFNLVALYTLRKQTVFVLGSSIYFPEEKAIFRLQTSYSHYPDKTWGIGNTSPGGAKEDYSIHQFYLYPQLLRKFFYDWYAGISYEYQRVGDFIYEPNGVFDQQNIPGRYGGDIAGFGFLLSYDNRNSAYSPSKGILGELNFISHRKGVGSDFNFNSLLLDVRKFFALSDDRVLAMQMILKDNKGDVPIRNLALLGGSEMMRGYYYGRYADKDMIAYQAELRQFLFWRLGLVAFGGLGEVADKVSNFRLDGFHFAAGGGLRLMVSKKEKLNLRIDYGFGKQSGGLYVILKEAF